MLSPFLVSSPQVPNPVSLPFASKRVFPHLPTHSHLANTSIPLPWGIKFPQD